MEHKHTNEQSCEHYLYRICGRADTVQWFNMLTECFSVSFSEIIYLIKFVNNSANPLQFSLTVYQCFTQWIEVLVYFQIHLEERSFGVKVSAKEFKYITFWTKTDRLCPHCILLERASALPPSEKKIPTAKHFSWG